MVYGTPEPDAALAPDIVLPPSVLGLLAGIGARA
jgi:hypothetical protein